MPSGMGSSCSPQLDPTDTANANMYSSTYRSQFSKLLFLMICHVIKSAILKL